MSKSINGFSSQMKNIILIYLYLVLIGTTTPLDCDRQWPELELFLPLNPTSIVSGKFSSVFLKSLKIHWPVQRSKVSLVLVAIDEKDEPVLKSIVQTQLNENTPNINIKHHSTAVNFRKADDKLLHLLFHPDLYTDKEYVGFVDADSVIIATIDREDIFENNKPIIHGQTGIMRNKIYLPSWARATHTTLGMEEPMICEGFYPLVVKVSHIRQLRQFISDFYRKPFDDAFVQFTQTSKYSVFNVMCTYLFWKKKDDYSWVIHDTDPLWSGTANPAPEYAQWSERWIFPNTSFVPKPFISMNTKYHSYGSGDVAQTIVRSMCHTKPLHNPIGLDCTEYLTRFPYHDELHRAEFVDFNTLIDHSLLEKIQTERQKRFEDCDISFGVASFKDFFKQSNYDLSDYPQLLFMDEAALLKTKGVIPAVAVTDVAVSVQSNISPEQQYCDRKWPSLDLLLPVGITGGDRSNEWYNWFLNSLMIYWPIKRSQVSLVLVVDSDVKGRATQEYIFDNIEKTKGKVNAPNIVVKYQIPTMKYRWGHDRQQYLMFYPELYTDKEYVGFVDTDCIFTASIDREDIFENSKPVVHGQIGIMNPRNLQHPMWSKSTYMALGLDEPMICMSFFPVVVKVSHLKELREFIVQHMQKQTFEEAFADLTAGDNRYSQFNIMCAYMFWKQKDSYTWIIHDSNPEWDGVSNPTPHPHQWADKSVFAKESFVPKPFIALHARYHDSGPYDMDQTIVRSMCHTRPKENPIGLNCTNYLKEFPYHDELHSFEYWNYNKLIDHSSLEKVQLERQQRFEHCDISYGKEQFLQHFGDKHYEMHHYQKLLFSTQV